MAEENSNTLESSTPQTSPEGGQSEASTPTSDARTTTATPSAPAEQSATSETSAKKEPKKAVEKPFNLYENEDFRKFQSAQNAQLERERQARLAEQQRADKLAAEIREQRVSGMNEYEKAQFEAEEARQIAAAKDSEIAALQAQIKQVEMLEIKRKDMEALHEKTGIPVEELDKARSYEEARDMAMDYMTTSFESKLEERVDAALQSTVANSTDTGGGAPAPTVTESEQARADAIERNDGVSLVKSLFG